MGLPLISRSSISLSLSGLSVLGRTSSFTSGVLKKTIDDLKRAFSYQVPKITEKMVNATTLVFRDLDDTLKTFNFYVENGLLKAVDTAGNNLTQIFGKDLIDVFSAFHRGVAPFADHPLVRSFTIPQLKISEQSMETKVPKSLMQIVRMAWSEISQGPLITKLRSIRNREGLPSFSQLFRTIKGMKETGNKFPAFNIGTRGKNAFKWLMDLPFNFLGKTGNALKSFGGKTWNAFGKILGVAPGKWTALGKGLAPVLGMGLMGGALGILISIVMALLDALNPFRPLLEALTTIFGVYGEILSTAFMPVIEALFEVMLSDNTIQAITTLATTFAYLMTATIVPLIRLLGPLGEILLNVIVFGVQAFVTILTVLSTPLMTVVSFFGQLFQWISNFISFLSSSFAPVFHVILDIFTSIIKMDFEAIKKNYINVFIDIINGIIRIINAALGWARINIKEIPKLAEGGLITKPTLAIVGEKGPELITPYSELKSQKKERGDIYITIYGDITEEKLRDLRHEMLIKEVF